MLLTCSNDLQRAMKVTLGDASEENPMFCWYAHTFRLGGRNCVLIINPDTWFAVVLWGVKAKDYAALPKKLLDYIRQLLKSFCVSDEIIEAYLADCGTVTLAKNSSRKNTARLNSLIVGLKYYQNESQGMDAARLLQVDCSHDLNYLPHSDGYKYPYERFLKLLKEKYPCPLYDAVMYTLKITLNYPDFEISRVVRLPGNTTFRDLHIVIQKCFNWEDYHLYEFSLDDAEGNPEKLIQPKDLADYGEDCGLTVPTAYDTDCTIGEIFSQTNEVCYVYDMGDCWEHTIRVLGVTRESEDVEPTCLEVTGKAPPEDCGGFPGYKDLLDGVPEMVEWVESARWEEQTTEEITRRLRW